MRGAPPIAVSLDARFAQVMDGFAAHWPGAVAVSGGGDSLALMHLLAGWAKKARKAPPMVLVVDHGLRTHSRKEALGAAKKARALGLAATVLTAKGLPSRGGLEAAAREARYGLMGAWLRRRKLGVLYVGHSQDDQAETFLLRLARGSGLDGLAAMRPIAPWPDPDFSSLAVARPLLGITRAELRAYLAARGEDWVEDPMNDDPRFDRVRMRRLAPALAQAGLTPARIALAASHMADARAALEMVTEAVLARAVRATPTGAKQPGLLLDPEALAAAPRELSLRALAGLLQTVSGATYRPRFAALERLAAAMAGPGSLAGMTLSGCRIGPAPATERLFGPRTLKLTREKPRKGPI